MQFLLFFALVKLFLSVNRGGHGELLFVVVLCIFHPLNILHLDAYVCQSFLFNHSFYSFKTFFGHKGLVGQSHLAIF